MTWIHYSQEKLLGYLATGQGKKGQVLARDPCPFPTAGPTPWIFLRSCKCRSLQRKGTDEATCSASFSRPRACNRGAGYKRQYAFQNESIFDGSSQLEIDTVDIFPFWHKELMLIAQLCSCAGKSGRERSDASPCKYLHECLMSLLWANSLLQHNC